MSESPYSILMKDVAKNLLGAPNKNLSNANEWRYGSNGSLSIDVKNGVWKDFENGNGGGVRELIAQKIKGNEKDVNSWLSSHGLNVPPPQQSNTTLSKVDKAPQKKLVSTYDYTNALGEVVYQVCRFEIIDGLKKKKTFSQRRLDESGQWVYNLKGVQSVPYKLDRVLEAISLNKKIYIVEGEKDVDKLTSFGLSATTNSGGASNWPSELCGYFAGANVVIIPDNDDAGRSHAKDVATSLNGVATSISLLEIPNLPDKGDISDFFDGGGTIEQFNTLVEQNSIPYAGEEIFKSKFHALRWADIDLPVLEHQWLIKGILTRGERSMCAGPSQSGKSFAVLDIALSVARGIDYQALAQIGGEGNYSLRSFKTKRGGVIYQAGEGGRGLKKRLKAYRKHHNLEGVKDLPFVLLPSPVDLYGTEEPTKSLIHEITHWAKTFDVPLELVVIDTLSAATPGANENASEDMSKVLMRCEKIARETNAHVMFVHHMNSTGEKPRGHTSIFANLDSVLTIKRTDEKDTIGKDIREITLTKNKDAEDGTNIKFVLKGINLGVDEDGDQITSCVCIPPIDYELLRKGPQEKAITLNDDLRVGLMSFFKALDEQGQISPSYLKLPRDLKVVLTSNYKKVFDAFTPDRFGVEGHDKERALRLSFNETLKGLISKEVIVGDGEFLWHTGKQVKDFPRTKHSPKQFAQQFSNIPWEDE